MKIIGELPFVCSHHSAELCDMELCLEDRYIFVRAKISTDTGSKYTIESNRINVEYSAKLRELCLVPVPEK